MQLFTTTQIFARYTFLAMFVLLVIQLPAQSGGVPELRLEDVVPTDPNVRMGTLENGIKYYIRKNREPENRAELRLAINAGSMQEDEDQQGLAHFTEHMCFNGTKHFEKSELVDYLESIGTKFGAHLNAYTSFDETVYMLQLPTDDPEIMKNGLLVLEDWANAVSFDDEEIDKERGVVIEEWRLGQGAQERMRKKWWPVLFKDSRYAERLPIGKKDILENFDYETIKRFYKDWYRPDLMSVVAVGDFDVDQVEEMIKTNFSKIPSSDAANPRAHEDFPVADTKGTLVVVATDKETPTTAIQILYKHPAEKTEKIADYKNSLVDELITTMLDGRYQELQQLADPPFIYSGSFKGSFIRTKSMFGSFAMVNPTGIERGIETILTENERAKQHGFVSTELDRAKKSMLKSMESAFNERDKTPSRGLAMEYVRNFLEDEPIPGIETEYEIYKKFLPLITIEEVNQQVNKLIIKDNRVILVMAPEKEGLPIPSEEKVLSIVSKVESASISKYEDKVDDGPLVKNLPSGGKVATETKNEKLGLTKWTLSNGCKVILKPTDFKSDEIMFSAYSPGGTSRYAIEDFISADNAADIVEASGIDRFDQSALSKKLAGKIVSVSPWIGELEEGMRGECVNADFETMMQLIYLYFTSPRKDSDAFSSYQNKMKGLFATMKASPESAFRDTLRHTMTQGHPRRQIYTAETFDKIDQKKAFEIYLDRFSDASDFTFVFVGSFDPEKIKPAIELYLGGIPGFEREEMWKDHKIEAPKGVIKKIVRKGVEPKSLVTMMITGPLDWNYENRFQIRAMVSVLKIMMREALREEKGGTYFVRANPNWSKYPKEEYQISLGFGCAPENVDELIASTMEKIEELKEGGASEKNLTKIKETTRREWEVNQKDNNYWLNNLEFYFSNGEDANQILNVEENIENLSTKSIKKTAKKYLNTDNMVTVILKPVEE